MQNVKIISVTDFDGNPKDEWIWGAERRFLCSPMIGYPMILEDLKLEKTRITSNLKAIQDGSDNQTKYYTLNSIYTLEELKCRCKHYRSEYGWCKLKMDWNDAMPIITWCDDEFAKQCEDYNETVILE